MNRSIPILRIEDFEVARAFYVDFLGFQVDFSHRYGPEFPIYLQVSLGDVILHLSEHEGDNPVGIKCHIEVDDLDGLIEKWQRAQPERSLKARRMPWNGKYLLLNDPFGNALGFNQALKSRES